MELLLDPNVAYLLLVGGFLLAILALFSPGSGVVEAAALVVLLLAGYGIANQAINWWALVILLVGVFPFMLALRVTKRWLYLLLSLIALVVGSIFLIRVPGRLVAVHPLLAIVASAISVGFLWVIAHKSLEALAAPPKFNLERLIGKVGVARSPIHHEGMVYVGGEQWSARSEQPIPSGARVRVLAREGLTLIVEVAN